MNFYIQYNKLRKIHIQYKDINNQSTFTSLMYQIYQLHNYNYQIILEWNPYIMYKLYHLYITYINMDIIDIYYQIYNNYSSTINNQKIQLKEKKHIQYKKKHLYILSKGNYKVSSLFNLLLNNNDLNRNMLELVIQLQDIIYRQRLLIVLNTFHICKDILFFIIYKIY